MSSLAEQYTEIARLAGGLAHEIKNPLSTIRLNMELLEEDLEEVDTPQGRRALKKVGLVQKECRRLEELLNDFLDFAKAHRLELQPADVNHEIKDVLEFFRPKANDSKIEIVEYLASNLPTVPLDRRSFHRALLNLVLNGQQAMPQGGQLVVRTRPVGSDVAIDLIDTGCGMDAGTLEHLFETFYSTKRGGSGLGLPTTRKIIDAHGGRMTVQSEPNCGTQFTIMLPSLPRIGAGVVRDAKSALPSPRGRGEGKLSLPGIFHLTTSMEEHVLVVPTALFHELGYFQGFCRDVERYRKTLLAPENVSFRPRSEVEKDPSFKQLIPYMIFSHAAPDGTVRLFQYVRGKGAGESRLRSKKSVGVGGHLSADDVKENGTPHDFYREGMLRELREEVVLDSAFTEECVGMINDDLTEVGKVHLGIVHRFELAEPKLTSNEPDLIESGFVPVADMLRDLSGFESWSSICLDALYGGSGDSARCAAKTQADR